MSDSRKIEKAISTIERIAREHGIKDAFFIGGYPRAMAMGLPLDEVHDLDIASSSPEDASLLAGLVAEEMKAEIVNRHRSRAITLKAKGLEMDFQGPASHQDVAPYLNAWGIQSNPLSMNIFDRDFTINSLMIPLGSKEVIDLTGRGIRDIENSVIASILPADEAVSKNPLMITRAIRFAYRYGFKIAGDLWKAMQKYAPLLKQKMSPERLAIEAYVLSKYKADKTLASLGLKYLASPALVSAGEEKADE